MIVELTQPTSGAIAATAMAKRLVAALAGGN
jgi:hypothetical protein